jgi:hypothetical protein
VDVIVRVAVAVSEPVGVPDTVLLRELMGLHVLVPVTLPVPVPVGVGEEDGVTVSLEDCVTLPVGVLL